MTRGLILSGSGSNGSNCKWMTERPLVLVVDDDDDNLLLMSYALESFGVTFIGESDGQAALDLARDQAPDLILSDIVLPNISGIEFLHLLKQDNQICHIPVIAVTALASADDRENLLAEGFVDYISKPFLIEDLQLVIERYFPLLRLA